MPTLLTDQQIVTSLQQREQSSFNDYYAFYSSYFGGITTNPRWLLLPLDDHMVHRGDGIFEGIKCIGRGVYQLDAHLKRLVASAERLDLSLPYSVAELKNNLIATLQVADRDAVMVRLFVSRGPGNFSLNPYDTIGSQVYVVVHRLQEPAALQYQQGVRIGKSIIPAKTDWMASIKSCNYLPNVLMKKEAVDRELDYVVSCDEQGFVTEGAAENILIVDATGTLRYPVESVLPGVTLQRVLALAEQHDIPTAAQPFTMMDVFAAREVMLTGTSINVLPVVECEHHQIATGQPGGVTKHLLRALQAEIQSQQFGTPF